MKRRRGLDSYWGCKLPNCKGLAVSLYVSLVAGKSCIQKAVSGDAG